MAQGVRLKDDETSMDARELEMPVENSATEDSRDEHNAIRNTALMSLRRRTTHVLLQSDIPPALHRRGTKNPHSANDSIVIGVDTVATMLATTLQMTTRIAPNRTRGAISSRY